MSDQIIMKNNIEEQESFETVEQTTPETHTQPDNVLMQCQEQLALWQDKYMRLNADFDNYRKRTAKEQVLWRQNGQKEILLPLLDIVDNFDRALKKDVASEQQAWQEGFILIRKALDKLLFQFGVEPMDNYQVFDPVFHEALAQVESPNHQAGAIVEVIQPGYLMKDTSINHTSVLRTAKVTIAK